MQTVTITTNVVSSNPAYGKVYSIQYYVIKFVNDLRQVGGFLHVLRFPPPIKLCCSIDNFTNECIKKERSTPIYILKERKKKGGDGCLFEYLIKQIC